MENKSKKVFRRSLRKIDNPVLRNRDDGQLVVGWIEQDYDVPSPLDWQDMGNVVILTGRNAGSMKLSYIRRSEAGALVGLDGEGATSTDLVDVILEEGREIASLRPLIDRVEQVAQGSRAERERARAEMVEHYIDLVLDFEIPPLPGDTLTNPYAAILTRIDNGGGLAKLFLGVSDRGDIGVWVPERSDVENIKAEAEAGKISLADAKEKHVKGVLDTLNAWMNGETYGVLVAFADEDEGYIVVREDTIEDLWGVFGYRYAKQVLAEEMERMVAE